MAEFCVCGTAGTIAGGLPDCVQQTTEASRLIMVQPRNADGSEENIPAGTTLDQAYFQGKFYRDDNPWVLLERHDNYDSTRDASITQTFTSGAVTKVDQGARTVTLFYPGAPAAYGQTLKAFECKQYAYFIVTADGSLRGMKNDDGSMRPIRVLTGSWDPIQQEPIKGTPTIQGWNLTFQVDIPEEDALLIEAETGNITGIDLNTEPGIIGVELAINTTATVNNVVVDAFYGLYQTFGGSSPFVGGDTTDFTVFNVTASSAVVLTSATQNPDGTYDLAFAAPVTLADELEISITAPSTTNKPFRGINTVTSTAA